MKITMAHGSGGKMSSELIESIFSKHFSNDTLDKMEDSASVQGNNRLAVTTDSFVVTPIFFPGGDIGHLSICGTVNDLLMIGAVPKYLTCGFILEEGLDINELEKISVSMARTANEAGVKIIAGDTKVIEGKGGIYINTTGIGFLADDINISASNCSKGDVIILSGNLGDHHAAIMSSRMGIENQIQSDCAPLCEMIKSLLDKGIKVKAMRDVTRGGLATVLNEFARSSKTAIELDESSIPVSEQVKGFCGILGLDPLYMGNEGKMVAVVSEEDAQKTLNCIKNSRYGENAAIIGRVCEESNPILLLKTHIGGTRIISELYGEGLPRIC